MDWRALRRRVAAALGAAPAEPPPRLVVERVADLQVHGWAATVQGTPVGQLALEVPGQPEAIGGERQAREDVREALALARAEDLGFSLLLPPAAWDPVSLALRPVQVRADTGRQPALSRGQEPPLLLDQLAGLLARPAGTVPEAVMGLALATLHVTRAWSRLPPAMEQAWRLQAALRDVTPEQSVPVWPWPTRPVVRAALESGPGLLMQGWAWCDNDAPVPLRLQVDGQLHAVQPVWLDRADVQLNLGGTRTAWGFELALPASIWSARTQPEAGVQLQLWAGPVPLLPAPWALAPADVLGRLAPPDGDRAAGDAQDLSGEGRHRHLLRLIWLEHVAASGVWQACPLPEQSRLFELAALLQVEALFPQAARLTAQAAAAQRLADASDLAQQQQVWAWMARFNARIDTVWPAAHPVALPSEQLAACFEPAWAQWCAEHDPSDAISQQLLWSITPFFCGQGAFDRLLPWLDGAALAALTESSPSSWSWSLALPVWLARGDWVRAQAAAAALAAQPAGWLNTECVAESVRRLREGLPAHQASARGVAGALLRRMHQEAADHWGRSHDLHLVQACVDLLAWALAGGDAPAWCDDILAIQGLNPGFWQRWEALAPPPDKVPSALGEWSRAWQATQAALGAGGPVATPWTAERWRDWWQASAVTRRARSPDAPLCLRQVAWQCLQAPQLEDGLRAEVAHALIGHSPGDAMRLAAWPGWGAGEAGWTERLRQIVWQASQRHALSQAQHDQALLLRRLMDPNAASGSVLADDGPLWAWTGAEHQAVGFLWLAWHHRVCGRDPAWLDRLWDTWCAAVEQVPAGQWPSPALAACWPTLAAGPAGSAAPNRLPEALARLSARFGASLAQAWRMPSTPVLQPPADRPWQGMLVAVLPAEDGATPTTAPAWLAELTRQGGTCLQVQVSSLAGHAAPKAEWSAHAAPDEAGAAPGGDWPGRRAPQRVHLLHLHLPADAQPALSLRLALAEWVLANTAFTHLLLLPADAHLQPAALDTLVNHLAHDHVGHRPPVAGHSEARQSPAPGLTRVDSTPAAARFGDSRAGLVLSRWALASLCRLSRSRDGARLIQGAQAADPVAGGLLALGGLDLTPSTHQALVRSRPGAGDPAVPLSAGGFWPSSACATLVTHPADDADAPPIGETLPEPPSSPALAPASLWPMDAPPSLGDREAVNQLVLLSPTARARAWLDAPVVVVVVVRNEALILPHFLDHYRAMGVRHFVVVDNLSTDGSTALLAAQDDVLLYSVATPYRLAHYGVAWQQAVLAHHGFGRWVVVADADEFLMLPGPRQRPLLDWLAELDAEGAEAALTLMVDLYPPGPLASADLRHQPPFEAAPCLDRTPLRRWHLGSGCYSNGPTWVSGLRHRLIPGSAPNQYTSQKWAVLRPAPWVRLSEGLHYASNLRPSAQHAWFAHFKYHAAFAAKVIEEVARKQHYNGAEEYRQYMSLWRDNQGRLHNPDHSADLRHAAPWLQGSTTPVTPGSGAIIQNHGFRT